MLLLASVLLAASFETFDAPLDPTRWFVGTPREPEGGVLHLPRDGWIVSRGIDGAILESVEIAYRAGERDRGGSLRLTFHGEREPLSSPLGEALVIPMPRGDKGEHILKLTAEGATLDGLPLESKCAFGPTFRIEASKGELALLEVNVSPRMPDPAALPALARRTVHYATTPLVHREAEEDRTYSRVTLTLWDTEVAFLFRRGATHFAPLAGRVAGSPVLGALVSLGHGGEVARKAATHPLAMSDWRDESRNLGREEYERYLAEEYELFEILQHAQRALNAALPARRDLEPLVHLAVIRHADNASAAVALAETEGARGAIAALRKALGSKVELARASGDQLRTAAAEAARAILGEPPAEWPGFDFAARGRFASLQQGKELTR